MTPRSSSLGFTFIEVMIAVVIMGVMLAYALPNYSTWIKNSHIRNASESVLNGLQRARAEAVVRNASVSFQITADTNLWTVTDVATGELIFAKPMAEISPSITYTVLPAGATTVVFGNLGTVTNGAAAITQIDFDTSDLPAEDSRNLRVTLGAGGAVRTCDPDPGIAASDPRHC